MDWTTVKSFCNRALIHGVTLLALCQGFSAIAGATETRDVFAARKGDVTQIRILDRTSGAKTSIGSGFWVGPNGLLISNFHVISPLVHKPDQYRAEFITEHGPGIALKLIDVDVVHDLALLKADTTRETYFTIQTENPSRGERLYSLGNPHDLGLVIVEGTYNGFRDKSLYKKIHFTGSINSGMSGGPTVNAAGEVVGVNVATAGNQVSFLVPSGYVQTLLERAARNRDIPRNFSSAIRDQLVANQSDYLDALLAEPFVLATMSDYTVPGRLAGFLNCWGDTKEPEDVLYDLVYQTCSTRDDIFLTRHQRTGIISFRHELYGTSELDSVRFFNFLEGRFKTPRMWLKSDEEMVTNYECQNGVVKHNGVESKTVFCIRAYKKYEGLYDTFFSATALTESDSALLTTLLLGGTSHENAVRFAQAYLESVKWNE